MDEDQNEMEQDPVLEDRDAGYWVDLIKRSQDCFSDYNKKCDNIAKQYSDLNALSNKSSREYNIFWANMEVLKPSVYSRTPVPVVVPRYKDRKELPRISSELIERCLTTSFDLCNVNSTMIYIRDDLLLNGRGVAWLRYEADDLEGEAFTEKVVFEHINRRDFMHDPARKWEEVSWVARRSWLTKEEGIERFGEIFRSVEFKETLRDDENKRTYSVQKASVWEIWHKSKGVVVWVTEGLDEILDAQRPLLNLDGFFPCPKPVYSTVPENSLIPVPDYVYYKDQCEEINKLTQRIGSLSEAVKMKGFYAKGAGDVGESIESALNMTSDNAVLVGVSSVAMFGQGMGNSIVWMPIADIVSAIDSLINIRRQIISDVYEITGLSDIMRGASDPNETLGAQELKSQYASTRIKDKQAELTRISRDMSRIAGEIMSENFQGTTLLNMAQMELPDQQSLAMQAEQIIAQAQSQGQMAPPEAQQQIAQQAQQQLQSLQNTVTIDKVVEFLRAQKVRPFAIDIETDSTIQPNEDAEKQRRNEFMTVLTGFLQQAAPLVQMQPDAAPFVAEVLKFVTAPYRAGRELEGVIDDFAEKMKQLAGQQQGPSPEQMKAEADAKAQESEMQAKQMDMQMRMQESQANLQIESEKASVEIEKTKAEIQKIYADIQRIQTQSEMMASKPKIEEKAA